MPDDRLIATVRIDAAADDIFAALADPATHATIDGTGRVTRSLDVEPLTHAGQLFRMAMFHPDHPERPDGKYETVNEILDFDRPRTISWKTGYEDEDGLHFAGWYWRYDLTPDGDSSATVRLTYDWSAVSDDVRELIGFPPFPVEHLYSSLGHLGELVTGAARA